MVQLQNCKSKDAFKIVHRKTEEKNEKSKTIDLIYITFKNKPKSTKYEKAYLSEVIAVENFAQMRKS